jgi:hypothetical protein
MKNCPAISAVLLLASCTPAMGRVPGFSELDADRDGRISRKEAGQSPELMRVFDRADTNGDGFLDSVEYQNALALIRQRDFRRDGGHQRPQH